MDELQPAIDTLQVTIREQHDLASNNIWRISCQMGGDLRAREFHQSQSGLDPGARRACASCCVHVHRALSFSAQSV